MKKEIFKKAHNLTKEIIRKGDSYRATFKLALTFIYSKIKKGLNKMVELKGTEKQVKWAVDLRKERVEELERLIEDVTNVDTDNKAITRNNIRRRLKIKKSEVGGTREAVTKALLEKLNDIKTQILNIEDATFFINTRYYSNTLIVENYVEDNFIVKY